MENYMGQFGRKFNNFQDYKEYVKSLTPSEVNSEFKWLSSQQITPEIEEMYSLCKAALIHIELNWSHTF